MFFLNHYYLVHNVILFYNHFLIELIKILIDILHLQHYIYIFYMFLIKIFYHHNQTIYIIQNLFHHWENFLFLHQLEKHIYLQIQNKILLILGLNHLLLLFYWFYFSGSLHRLLAEAKLKAPPVNHRFWAFKTAAVWTSSLKRDCYPWVHILKENLWNFHLKK